MAKHGLIRALTAVEIACGLSVGAAMACDDQLGYPEQTMVEESGLENAKLSLLVLPPAKRSSEALSTAPWGGTRIGAAPHEQINQLGGS